MQEQFKQHLKEVTASTVTDRRHMGLLAKVIKTNEKNNSCDVLFADKNGNTSSKRGIRVKLGDAQVQSWFPELNDIVYLDVYENTYFITGPYYKDYNLEAKSKYRATNNILPGTLYSVNEGILN